MAIPNHKYNFKKMTTGYGYVNGRRKTITTLQNNTDFGQVRQDCDFVLSRMIGDLDAGVGDRKDVLVDLVLDDLKTGNESVFPTPLPWDSVFGSPQFPAAFLRRRLPNNSRISVQVYNNTANSIQYNWLLWGYNLYFNNPINKDRLVEDVWTQPGSRQSLIAFTQSSAGNNSLIFPGGVAPVPAGGPGGPGRLTAVSKQVDYPFLMQEIRGDGTAILEELYIQMLDITGARDSWFTSVDGTNDGALARMILGNAGNPMLFEGYESWRIYNQLEYIQADFTNYSFVSSRVPLQFWGLKSNLRASYDPLHWQEKNQSQGR